MKDIIKIIFFILLFNTFSSNTNVFSSEITLPFELKGDIDNDTIEETIKISKNDKDKYDFTAIFEIIKNNEILYSDICGHRIFQCSIENLKKKEKAIFLFSWATNASGTGVDVIRWNGKKYEKIFTQQTWTARIEKLGKNSKKQILLKNRYDIPKIYEYDEILDKFIRVDMNYPEIYHKIIKEIEEKLKTYENPSPESYVAMLQNVKCYLVLRNYKQVENLCKNYYERENKIDEWKELKLNIKNDCKTYLTKREELIKKYRSDDENHLISMYLNDNDDYRILMYKLEMIKTGWKEY
ncbi:MAG: hypothetical protein WC947_05980 [Elusimicrobiota bacterium]